MSRSQLLFLPAAGRVAADFEPIRDELGRDRRSRALDWPAGEHGVASLARWVIEETRDWREPMVVVGHSVGGAAGIELAIARPELVRGLILVDSAGFLELGFFERLFCRVKGIAAVTRTIEPRFARWHTRVHNRDTDAMIARVEANRGRPGWAEGVASIWRSFTRPEADLLVRARQLAIPTLIVWGEHDPVIPMRAARAAERAIPGARLVTFPTGHTPFLEAREGFLAAAVPKRPAAASSPPPASSSTGRATPPSTPTRSRVRPATRPAPSTNTLPTSDPSSSPSTPSGSRASGRRSSRWCHVAPRRQSW